MSLAVSRCLDRTSLVALSFALVLVMAGPLVAPSGAQSLDPISVTTGVLIVGGDQAVSDEVLGVVRAQTGATVLRLAGQNRFDTAAEIAALFTPGRTAIIASGADSADALAGIPLARALGAPILLVEEDRLPAETVAALAALSPADVVILGGPEAIADDVVTQVDAATGAPSRRVAGPDRFGTAGEIAVELVQTAGVERVYVASGRRYAETLAAGVAAGALDSLMLLTEAGFLPERTRTELLRLVPDEIVLVGDTEAVSAAVEAELAGLAPTVRRLSGPAPSDTALAVAHDTWGPEVMTVFLATPDDFADALTIGSVAAGTDRDGGRFAQPMTPGGPVLFDPDHLAQAGPLGVVVAEETEEPLPTLPPVPPVPAVGDLTPSDIPPTAVDDVVTVVEDGAAVTFDPLANDLNADAGPMALDSFTQPALGTVSQVAGTDSLTYTPDVDACTLLAATDTFTYALAPGGASATVAVTITCVNDAPTAVVKDVTLDEDAGSVVVDDFVSDVSPGPANESSQTTTVTMDVGAPQPPVATRVLALPDPEQLFDGVPALDPVTGNLTLTLLPDVNDLTVPITVTVTDDGGTDGGGVDTTVYTVNLAVRPVNDAPIINGPLTLNLLEDVGEQVIPNFASPGPVDEAGQTLSAVVTGDTSMFSSGPTLDPDGTLRFTPLADAFGLTTLSITVADDGGTDRGGVDTSAPVALGLSLDAVNDAPSVVLGTLGNVLEDAGLQTILGFAHSKSAGPDNESTQTVTLHTSGYDTGLFTTPPAIDAAGNLTFLPASNAFGATTVTVTPVDDGGTANGGVDTGVPQTFDITLLSVNDLPYGLVGATISILEDAGLVSLAGWMKSLNVGPVNEAGQTLGVDVWVRAGGAGLFAAPPAVDPVTGDLTFTPAADAFGAVDVTFTPTDDGGTDNGGVNHGPAQTVNVGVRPVNDAPTAIVGQLTAVLEDALGVTVPSFVTNISPGPANEVAQTVTTAISVADPLLFAVQPTLDSAGTLAYTPAPNLFGVTTLTVTLTDDGGTLDGGDHQTTYTRTLEITSVQDPVIAPDINGVLEGIFAFGNTLLVGGGATVPGVIQTSTATSLLDGVVHGDGPVEAVSCTSRQGTCDIIDGTTGAFMYLPELNREGLHTISFVLRDVGDHSDTDTGTLTVPVGGDVLYVSELAVCGCGTGSSRFPALSVTDLPTAGAGDTIYVYDDQTGTTQPPFQVPSGVTLLGQDVGLTLPRPAPLAGDVTLHQAAGRPVFDARTVQPIVTFGANVVIRGIEIVQQGDGVGLVPASHTTLGAVEITDSAVSTAGAGDAITGFGISTLKLRRVDASTTGGGTALDLTAGILDVDGSVTTSATGGGAAVTLQTLAQTAPLGPATAIAPASVGVSLSGVGGNPGTTGTTVTDSGGTGITVLNAPVGTTTTFSGPITITEPVGEAIAVSASAGAFNLVPTAGEITFAGDDDDVPHAVLVETSPALDVLIDGPAGRFPIDGPGAGGGDYDTFSGVTVTGARSTTIRDLQILGTGAPGRGRSSVLEYGVQINDGEVLVERTRTTAHTSRRHVGVSVYQTGTPTTQPVRLIGNVHDNANGVVGTSTSGSQITDIGGGSDVLVSGTSVAGLSRGVTVRPATTAPTRRAHLLIHGVTAIDVGVGVDMLANNATDARVDIVGNNIQATEHGVQAMLGAMTGSNVDVAVESNTISSAFTGLRIGSHATTDTSRFHIEGNIVGVSGSPDPSTDAGIVIDDGGPGSTNYTIRGNTVTAPGPVNELLADVHHFASIGIYGLDGPIHLQTGVPLVLGAINIPQADLAGLFADNPGATLAVTPDPATALTFGVPVLPIAPLI